MELLNLEATLSVIMKTAGRNSAAYRACLQFRLAGESDLGNVIQQIQSLTHSESDDDSDGGQKCQHTNRPIRGKVQSHHHTHPLSPWGRYANLTRRVGQFHQREAQYSSISLLCKCRLPIKERYDLLRGIRHRPDGMPIAILLLSSEYSGDPPPGASAPGVAREILQFGCY